LQRDFPKIFPINSLFILSLYMLKINILTSTNQYPLPFSKKKRIKDLVVKKKVVPLQSQTGKCRAASSLQTPQGLIAARVVGCSGAIRRAFPPPPL